jgi:hypothetical protein
MIAIGIREEIVVLAGIVEALVINCLNIFTRRGVVYGHSQLWVAVNVVEKFVYVLIPDSRVGIVKVFAKSMEEIA